MDQKIGIQYEVKGQGEVFKTFDQMGTKLDTLNQKLDTAGTGFATLTSNAGRALPILKDTNRTLGSITGTARTASTAVGGLNSNLSALKANIPTRPLSVNISGPVGGGMPPMGGGRGGMGGGGGRGQSGFLGGYGPMGFMLRFMAFHKAFQLAGSGITDIGMGGTRKDIGKSLGELSAVGFNAFQKQDTEEAAHKFATKFFDQTADQYIKAMSQTASAFSIDKLGSDQLNRLNAAAMHTARMSKMAPDQAGLLQSQLINAYIGAQSKGVYQALQSGGTATTKAFGTTDIAGMGEKMMAQAAKAIEISNIWGKGMQDFQQYAGPVMYQKGWDPAAMMAMAGTMVDVGYKGAKSGRGVKSLLADPKAFAKLQILGEGLLTTGSTGDYKKREAEELRAKEGAINKAMKSGPEFFALLEKLAPALKKAVALSESPQGLSLLKDIGISKDFLPQFLSILKEGFIERVKGQYQQIKGAEYSELEKKHKDALDDTGFTISELTNKLTRFTAALAKGDGVIGKATKGIGDAFDHLGERQERENRFLTAKREIGKWRGGGGMVGDDMSKFKSATELEAEINKVMKGEYESRMKGIGAEPKDKEGSEWMAWDEKRQGAFKDVQRWGQTLWEDFQGQKTMDMGNTWQTQPMMTAELALGNFAKSLEESRDSVIKFGASLIGNIREHLAPRQPYQSPEEQWFGPDGQMGLGKKSSLSGEGQGATVQPIINITVPVRELREYIKQALADINMTNRNRYGNTFS